MSSDSTSLVIILVCLVLSAYFSATETAFSTMSHARMKTMADKGDKSAALALQLAQLRHAAFGDPDRQQPGQYSALICGDTALCQIFG